jgi:tetratricopeptide (TPR) repeat protein
VRWAALALAAVTPVALVASARGQEPAGPENPLPELAPDAVASVPGLDGDRARSLTAALRAGAYDRAEILLVEAAQREPVPLELLRLLGSVSFLGGNYLNAAIALKKAEARAPLDERSRFTLAMSYVLMGRRDWARAELRKLAEEAPRNALYPYWTARLDYDTGRYAEAVKALLAAVALDARFVKAYDNLGLCYEALGRFEEAVASYETAVRLNREAAAPSPWPPHNLGLLLTRLNRTPEAEPLIREALRHDARFAPAHYQLGVTLEKTGRFDEAVAELLEAARLDPKYPDPHYALARIFRRQRHPAEADRALAVFQQLKKEKDKAGSATR